jgi:hypothetical protein
MRRLARGQPAPDMENWTLGGLVLNGELVARRDSEPYDDAFGDTTKPTRGVCTGRRRG